MEVEQELARQSSERQVAGQGHGACVGRQASVVRGRVETDLGLGATEALGQLMFLVFSSVRVSSGLHLIYIFIYLKVGLGLLFRRPPWSPWWIPGVDRG